MTTMLRCHGAVEGVTGSCYELKDDALGVHLLIDCGMFQGEPTREGRNAGPLPFDARSLTHVVLTHAHLDHCGMLPRLYQKGYRGSVIATKETAALATAVLLDAAKIGAPYDKEDIARIRWHEPSKAVFGNYCPIANDVFLRFYRTSHIIGAVSVSVVLGQPGGDQTSITFSGDVGVNADGAEQLPLLGYRMSPEKTDWLVVESTYGATVRPPLTLLDRLRGLKEAIDEALFVRGGPVLMPAFALGRTQELICDLTLLFAALPGRYAKIPVYVDGRLNVTAGRILAEHIGRTYTAGRNTKTRNAWLGAGFFRAVGLDKDDPDDMDVIIDCLKETFRPESGPALRSRRKGVLANWRCITQPPPNGAGVTGPAIVIAGAGMCDAGPIQRHLADHADDPKATILFSGYCGPGTVGGALLQLGALPEAERRRSRQPFVFASPTARGGERVLEGRHIAARIARLQGYSAHADQAGILDWMWSGKPTGPDPLPEPARRCIASKVLVSHGEIDQRRALRDAIAEKAAARGEKVEVIIPREADGWRPLR